MTYKFFTKTFLLCVISRSLAIEVGVSGKMDHVFLLLRATLSRSLSTINRTCVSRDFLVLNMRPHNGLHV